MIRHLPSASLSSNTGGDPRRRLSPPPSAPSLGSTGVTFARSNPPPSQYPSVQFDSSKANCQDAYSTGLRGTRGMGTVFTATLQVGGDGPVTLPGVSLTAAIEKNVRGILYVPWADSVTKRPNESVMFRSESCSNPELKNIAGPSNLISSTLRGVIINVTDASAEPRDGARDSVLCFEPPQYSELGTSMGDIVNCTLFDSACPDGSIIPRGVYSYRTCTSGLAETHRSTGHDDGGSDGWCLLPATDTATADMYPVGPWGTSRISKASRVSDNSAKVPAGEHFLLDDVQTDQTDQTDPVDEEGLISEQESDWEKL
ncbi:hypothetical protein IAU59_005244 [Kwoniella sp. CBS 9459]